MIFNCYSARKFFGVSDGAYLISNKISSDNIPLLPESTSSENSLYLMKTIEQGTNNIYQDHLANEKRLEKSYTKMSPLTQRILSSIDYQKVQSLRYKNLLRLHENLKDINLFQVNLSTKTQYYYPLLVVQEDFREKLVSNHIYTPTWWRHVPEQSNYAKIETLLSKYMVFLPIDQRYTISDMDDISEIAMKCRKI